MSRREGFTEDFKDELISIIKKANAGESFTLDSTQVSLLFYWVRHKDNREFQFVKDTFPHDPFINPKKKRSYKKKKSKKEVNNESESSR